MSNALASHTILFNLSRESVATRDYFPWEKLRRGLGQGRQRGKELSPGHLAMQMARHKQGLQPTLLIPSAFPEPQSIQQHQENHTQLKAAAVCEDTGGSTKATGEDEGLAVREWTEGLRVGLATMRCISKPSAALKRWELSPAGAQTRGHA